VGSDEGGGCFAAACFSTAVHAQVLAAAETALGLACFPDFLLAPYGSSVVCLHFWTLMCSAVSVLSTLPHFFPLHLTPMHAAIGGQDN
jgi:hypothetical protein